MLGRRDFLLASTIALAPRNLNRSSPIDEAFEFVVSHIRHAFREGKEGVSFRTSWFPPDRIVVRYDDKKVVVAEEFASQNMDNISGVCEIIGTVAKISKATIPGVIIRSSVHPYDSFTMHFECLRHFNLDLLRQQCKNPDQALEHLIETSRHVLLAMQ